MFIDTINFNRKYFKMRKKIMIIALMPIISLITSCTTQGSFYSQPGDQGYVDTQVFYDQLSPYGQWMDYPDYGNVWIPNAGPGFAPYETNGQWVMTEYGWTWISDYSWGWAPFHYGRWDFDARLGWFWIPDTEWGPAWVTWRRAEGYYGWAPMGPRMRVGYYEGNNDINRWHFVRYRDFGRQNINRYEINHQEYNNILRNSSVINNTHIDRRRNATYVAGPSTEEVQRVTGRRINSLAVRDNSRPGTVVNKDQVRIYRPQVQKSTRSAAPSNINSKNQVNPGVRKNSGDNSYLPNQRRNENLQRTERSVTVQPTTPNATSGMSRRQQRMEQRQMNVPQKEQNKERPFGQRKRVQNREERSQQIEQPQSQPQQSQSQQSSPQQSQRDRQDNQNGGRRR